MRTEYFGQKKGWKIGANRAKNDFFCCCDNSKQTSIPSKPRCCCSLQMRHCSKSAKKKLAPTFFETIAVSALKCLDFSVHFCGVRWRMMSLWCESVVKAFEEKRPSEKNALLRFIACWFVHVVVVGAETESHFIALHVAAQSACCSTCIFHFRVVVFWQFNLEIRKRQLYSDSFRLNILH